MNKYLSKIVGAVASLALVIGVGVGITSNKNNPVFATPVPSSTASTSISAGQYIITNGGNYLTGYSSSHIGVAEIPAGGVSGISATAAFTIAVSGDGWSIYQNSQSKYLGWSKGTDFAASQSAPSANGYRWSITLKAESIDEFIISNLGTPSRQWGFGSSDVRPYSSPSSGNFFKFYEVEESDVPATYTVTYNANGGTGTITDSNSPYNSGTTVTVKNSAGFTAPSGKEFSHWSTAASGNGGTRYNPGDTFNISDNTVLYARWIDASTEFSKVLTVGSNGVTSQNGSTPVTWSNGALTSEVWMGNVHFVPGGESGNNGFYYNTDTSWRFYETGYLTISIPLGYRFTSIVLTWKTGIPTTPANMIRDKDSSPTTYTPETIVTNLNSVTFRRDSNNFLLQKAAVNFEEVVPFDQTLSVNKESAYVGEEITVSSDAISAVTWSIVEGSDTTASGPAITSSGVVTATGPGNVTVKATASGYNDATKQVTFNELPVGNIYDITFDSDGGSNNPDSMIIEEGDTFEFPSPGTKEHYSFLGWTVDGEHFYDEDDTSLPVTSDADYLAWWEEDIKYAVTYTAGTNGTGSYTSNNYGGSYTLPSFASLTGVSADSGYRFLNYTVSGVHKNPGNIITLNSALEITVNFELIPDIDTLTIEDLGVDAYANWKDVEGDNSCAIYAGNCKKSAGDVIQLRASTGTQDPSGIVSTASGGTIKAVIIDWGTETSISRTINVYGSNTALTSADDLYGETPVATLVGSLEWPGTASVQTYLFEESYKYVGIRSSSGALYLDSVVFEWNSPVSKNTIESTVRTRTALTYNYSVNGVDDYTYSDVVIKFGGLITKTLWNALRDESGIERYGVLISTPGHLGGTLLKNAAVDGTNVKDYHTDITLGHATPAESGDYYIWNLCLRLNEAELTDEFTAVAYIKTTHHGTVYFVESTKSAQSIAQDLIDSGRYDDDDFDGSLLNLATM